ASGFALTAVRPLMGRPLLSSDELPSAPPVVVIGWDVWQTRFAADPGVVGRVVGLGETRATVVGVMPPGFGFPVNQRLWVPLRPSDEDLEAGRGPPVRVFARLAPGATMAQAQA